MDKKGHKGTKKKIEIFAEIPVCSFLVYVYICRIDHGRSEYLLLERKGGYMSGVWQPVTGRCEKNETAWQTALREVREETALRPERFYTCNIVERFYEMTQDCICLAPVFLAIVGDDQTVQISSEHGRYRWCGLDEAVKLLSIPQQQDTIKYIQQQFVENEPKEFFRIHF